MNDRATVVIPRGVALLRLSEIRYGSDAIAIGKIVSQPTLWRWIDLLGLPSSQECFTQAQFDRLAEIAHAYRMGKTTQQILETLTNEQNSNQTVAC